MTHLEQKSNLVFSNVSCVLAVGDCNTYGIHESPVGNTILDKFCRCLEQAGYPTCSQNLGFGSATSREGIALMSSRPVKADILLLNFGLVDSQNTSIPQVYIPCFPNSPSREIQRRLLKFAKRGLHSPFLRGAIRRGPGVPLEEYRTNVERMILLARQLNPAVWVLLWGSPPMQHETHRNEQLLKYNAELHDIATRMRATYLPTKPLIDNLSSAEAFLDNVHLNETATAVIAAEMAHAYLSQRQRTAA